MTDKQSANSWYRVDNVNDYDSPALLVYPIRIMDNIHALLKRVQPAWVRPHVKTNKTAEVCKYMLAAGISKFKAATIAEAEMLALIKTPDVLLAYPVTGPKISRLMQLVKKYPDTKFSSLADNAKSVKKLSVLALENQIVADVYIDLNVGMNRTGILPEKAYALFQEITQLSGLRFLGLHAYDGHIKEPDYEIRKNRCTEAFAPVLALKKQIETTAGHSIVLVAGGTPTSFIHAEQGDRECSPGTFVFWDMNYTQHLPEQPFEFAATLLCRVISIPSHETICVDLGYKAVASENPLPRVYFLNAADAIPIAHSEEHLVLKVEDSSSFTPGDVLYGIPWHICPTVSLYDTVLVAEDHLIKDVWKVTARNREISV
jgi:D-threonine aldolase